MNTASTSRCWIALVGALVLLAFSSAAQAQVSLGAAAPFTLLGDNLFVSSGTVNGTVGIGPNGTLTVLSGAVINGPVYQDPTATINNMGTINGAITTQSLSSALSAVVTASNQAAALTPNYTFTGLTSGLTVNATGTVTVVDINGAVSLNNANLVLNGAAGDQFIINIAGNMALTGTASILGSGGLNTSDILLNFVGTDIVTGDASSIINGTVLAPNTNVNLNGPVNGALLGGTQQICVNNTVTAVPEPSSIFLAVGALGILAITRRRRSRHHPAF